MKRVILGIGWFSIINFTINFIGGFASGFITAFTNPSIAGAEAGIGFTQKYGLIVFIASALIAIIGTTTGKLPYTQKDKPPQSKGAV